MWPTAKAVGSRRERAGVAQHQFSRPRAKWRPDYGKTYRRLRKRTFVPVLYRKYTFYETSQKINGYKKRYSRLP
jgi:hypothetical protein